MGVSPTIPKMDVVDKENTSFTPLMDATIDLPGVAISREGLEYALIQAGKSPENATQHSRWEQD